MLNTRLLTIGVLITSFLVGTKSASAVTTLGTNFDGVMSLIYNSSTGGMFVENAPLTNPAVERLVLASAGNALIPGNLTFPSLSPPVTVNSATTSLIDIQWSSGDFLGTGSSLGNILPASLLQPALLADLTIDWVSGGSPLMSGDLLYGTYGNLQSNPVLPLTGSGGFFRFFDVSTGQFFDPPLATGFEYTMTGGSLFTKVGLPIGLGNSFSVDVGGTILASNIPEGGQFIFPGSGVSSFKLLGIDPAVDAANADAFPVYLEFDTATASFDMQALTSSSAIPEPNSLVALLSLLCLFKRRNGR